MTWPTALLGDVVDVLDSQRKPITKSDRRPGPFPYYGATGVVDWVDGFLFEEPLVLVGEDGAKWGAGDQSAFRVEGKTWVNNHAHVLRPRREIVMDNWLVFFLNSADLSEYVSGLTVPKLNQGSLRQIEIPLPPLDEQRRIVAKLDQAFAALDGARVNAEANLADAEAVFEQTLLSTFDELLPNATMKPLAEAATDFSRGKSRHRPRNDPALYEGAYPFIQTGDVRQAQGAIREFSQTYNEFGLAQSKLWPVGTVCITIAANIAETGVLEMEACFPDSVIGMVPDPTKAMPYYVEYMLRYFSKELKLKGKGSAQDNINLATFEGAMFPFPALAQQKAVVEKLDALAESVSTLRGSYTHMLGEVAALRQSLLQAAFSGQLN